MPRKNEDDGPARSPERGQGVEPSTSTRRRRRFRKPPADAVQTAIFAAALDVFRERGYSDSSLEGIAAQAGLDPKLVEGRFETKEALLTALLQANSPLADIESALEAVQGDSAESILRDAFHRMATVAKTHVAFFELALIDAQANGGAFLASLNARLFPAAMALLGRMKAAGGLRPISDLVIGRAITALLLGYIASERAVPQIARMAMRILPERAWLDGVIDVLLYGLLEDDAR